MVSHTCNPNTWEAETGGLRILGQSWLYSESLPHKKTYIHKQKSVNPDSMQPLSKFQWCFCRKRIILPVIHSEFQRTPNIQNNQKKKKVDDAVILLLHICPEELKTGFKQTLVYQSSQLHYSPQAKGEKHLVSSDM
jgi:hypothetical protein